MPWLLLGFLLCSPVDLILAAPAKVESISCGSVNKGMLLNGTELFPHGLGYTIPKHWLKRGRRFGTESMVQLIKSSAEAVEKRSPGSRLAVADMSKRNGGPIGLHKSHQSGRDVDLIFYALDDSGKPFSPDSNMAYYGELGQGTSSRARRRSIAIKRRFFDLARNWQLIEYLVTQKQTTVTHIFVSGRVKAWLLEYSSLSGVDRSIKKKVFRLLKRDRKGLHNDHFHVRIGCDAEDKESQMCFESRTKNSLSALAFCRSFRSE